MCALPPKADIAERSQDVRFVPLADSCTAAKTGGLRQLLTDFREVRAGGDFLVRICPGAQRI
jgi:hypothetical protein